MSGRIVLSLPAAVIFLAQVLPATEPLKFPPQLPGTASLTLDRPLDVEMIAGIDRFALKEIARSRELRAERWQLDFSSSKAFQNSLASYREQFKIITGVVDARVAGRGIEDLAATPLAGSLPPGTRFLESETDRYTIAPVRWQVFEDVTAEGLLLMPASEEIVGMVIALPDATWTPEEFCGADPDRPEICGMPRWLVEQGFLVIVPQLINRDDTCSGNPDIAMTNQSHREWIYRQAFEVGRHIVGYEVQKVLAAVDGLCDFREETGVVDLPLCVVGVGDGGQLALYAAALDPRIDATLVSGYFQPREHVWQEPIDRNIWKQLTLFGDAEIAGMIAPRALVIEAAEVPEVVTPAPVKPGRRGGAAPGRVVTAEVEQVRQEFERVAAIYDKLDANDAVQLIVSGSKGTGPAGSIAAMRAMMVRLEIPEIDLDDAGPLKIVHMADPDDRQRRQVAELVRMTQRILSECHKQRNQIWTQAARSNVEEWRKSSKPLREMVWKELIGQLPAPSLPPMPRSRKILETKAYHGYEIVLDVYDDIIAGGILLLPADLKMGERRPVVVCQHGLEGTPMDTISGPDTRAFAAYQAFSEQLVQRGYVVYAPQNPYRGQDRFRTLQRKSNPLGRSLFSYIIPQHQVTLNWLKSQPWVDGERIAFYGISYGGKTAVRVPPFVADYALSICSADFNEWVFKNATVSERPSYMFTGEYEIFEWNMGHVANYAELTSLIAPRPFMVERGHDDGVAYDEWTAWEYAKVRRFYTKLGIGDRTEIEYFNGPHRINGQGTFQFLDRHLKWTPHDAGSRN